MKRDLAIYDMDQTITRVPTYTPFLIHVASRRSPWRLVFLPLVGASLLAYGLKLVDRARLKEINHRLLIGHTVSTGSLSPYLDSFAERVMRSNLRPGAREAIEADRAEGRMLVMATASYRFYSRRIGERLGFDHVIGTDHVEGADGAVCAVIAGENCYAAAKRQMVDAWIEEAGIVPGHLRFYSDHHSDGPMFDLADEPVAVNPDEKLAAMARANGWRVEDWG
ncbi:HAD-IB family hydrolase [Sphingomicrobium sp. XHP0239]|uniref:HAD family hydrolase n=1 Tax=Sphingomicrobium maritimum TaxID=3133972 RepID=UPI0031CC98CF